MVDVDDFGQIIGPVGAAVRMFARLPRGRLAARQHGRDRREEVAPVKASPALAPEHPVRPPAADPLAELVSDAPYGPAIISPIAQRPPRASRVRPSEEIAG